MGMNVFRFAGDMSHLFSIIVLLLRLRVAKNAQGTSFFMKWILSRLCLSLLLHKFMDWIGFFIDLIFVRN